MSAKSFVKYSEAGSHVTKSEKRFEKSPRQEPKTMPQTPKLKTKVYLGGSAKSMLELNNYGISTPRAKQL